MVTLSRESATPASVDDVVLVGRTPDQTQRPSVTVIETDDPVAIASYRTLRRTTFVLDQGLFPGSDLDEADSDDRTRFLLAVATDGTVLGGVRVHPVLPGRDLGWWRGSRLVVRDGAPTGLGAALIRAACALVETLGALRFDATVQARYEPLFTRLGWQRAGADAEAMIAGRPHVELEFPIGRIRRLAQVTKAPLGDLVGSLLAGPAGGGGPGFLGDDAAPVPGSDLVAACDAILPSMVERDPEWAGWCAVLVNLNDLFAMGATPVGILDAVAARDVSFARRIVAGLQRAAAAYGVPVLGGHTQFGVAAALSVTALGRTARPVPGGGGRPGERLRLTCDLAGGWRPGYHGSQWDSTSHRSRAELARLAEVVPGLRPTAAKDVSMSGLVGSTGMLAEASGCAAVLEVADIPTPSEAALGDWLTCFPGFAMITAESAPSGYSPPSFLTTASCGELVPGSGVALRWPDGRITEAVGGRVTGLGAA